MEQNIWKVITIIFKELILIKKKILLKNIRFAMESLFLVFISSPLKQRKCSIGIAIRLHLWKLTVNT